MFKKSVFVVLSCIFIQLNVFAEPTRSFISIDVGKDEQANTSSAVSVDLALEDSKQVMFGFGQSEIPAGSQSIDNDFVFLGVSNKVIKQWKIAGMLEYSGLKNAFTIASISIPVRYSKKRLIY